MIPTAKRASMYSEWFLTFEPIVSNLTTHIPAQVQCIQLVGIRHLIAIWGLLVVTSSDTVNNLRPH